MQIKKFGKFHIIDENGFIKNSSVLPIAQLDYRTVVNEILIELIVCFKIILQSVYIRGSVAKGIAIPNISDIDIVIIINRDLLGSELDLKNNICNKITSKYSFVNGIELLFINSTNCKETWIKFLLKTQCGCIYGNNLIEQIEDFKLDNSAFAHSGTFYQSMSDIREELLNETDPNEIKEICVWTMKRIIRTGYETVMLIDNTYTRDLYLNYYVFCKYHPNKSKEMKKALEMAINPVENKEIIFSVIDSLVDYICKNIIKTI